MSRLNRTSILTIGCLALVSFNTLAQQPASREARTPRLTSDDVAGSRSQPGGVTVLKTYDANKWERYSPGGLSLSVELPGGLEFLELPVPEEIKRESNYRDLKAYVYPLASLTALFFYMQHRSPPSSAELKETTNQLMDTIAHRAGHSNAGFTTESIAENKLLVSASYTKDGYELELTGSVESKAETVWWVLSIYQRGDDAARARAQRINKSITIN